MLSAAQRLSELPLSDASAVADLLLKAAQLNLTHDARRGSSEWLPARGWLYMTGDLHDHALNFQRLVKIADLDRAPDRHLVLHELVHGKHRVQACDLSIRVVARAAALKVFYPGQVHFLLANHDLAQVHGTDILKEGRSVVKAFNDGLDYLYSDDAPVVADAFAQFVHSMGLAVRTESGLFCAHSFPSPSRMAGFDVNIVDRALTDADFTPTGSATLMVWGRNHTREQADQLAKRWSCRQFVMGHQPAEMGYETEGDNMLILASDHEHGQVLPVDLAVAYDRAQLIDRLFPLNGIMLDSTGI